MNLIEIPVLNYEYRVRITWGEPKQIAKIANRLGYDDTEESDVSFDTFRGLCFMRKDKYPLIVIPHLPKNANEIGTLAHEATHAALWVCQQSNVYDDEFTAATVGAIVRRVMDDEA